MLFIYLCIPIHSCALSFIWFHSIAFHSITLHSIFSCALHTDLRRSRPAKPVLGPASHAPIPFHSIHQCHSLSFIHSCIYYISFYYHFIGSIIASHSVDIQWRVHSKHLPIGPWCSTATTLSKIFPGGPGTCWHNYNNHAYPFKINVYVNVDWHQTCISCAFIMCIRICVCVCDCVIVCVFTSIFLSWQVLAKIIVIANLRRYVYVKHWNEAKVDSTSPPRAPSWHFLGIQPMLMPLMHKGGGHRQITMDNPGPTILLNSYKFSKRTWKAQTQSRMNCSLRHLLALLFICDIFAKRKTQQDAGKAVSNLK